MYETKYIHSRGNRSNPERSFEGVRRLSNIVSMRTVLPWGEHCTECAWPTCYTTCDLYEARPGGELQTVYGWHGSHRFQRRF